MTAFLRSCLSTRTASRYTDVWRRSRNPFRRRHRVFLSALGSENTETDVGNEDGSNNTDAFVEFSQTPSFKASLDFKFVKENLELVKENCTRRKSTAHPEEVVRLYSEYHSAIIRREELRAARNKNSKAMQATQTAEEKQALIQTGLKLKTDLSLLETELISLQNRLQIEGQRLPNMTHPDAPIGGEENAVVIKTIGEKRPFQFPVKDHLWLGEQLDLIDFANAAVVSGSKFHYLKNAAALMEMALLNWTFQKVVSKGFTPITTPDLIRESVLEKCGFQPRAQNTQVYDIRGSDLALTGTAEVPLGGLYMNKVLSESALPIKMVAFGHCFRTEAGSPGTASKGLYRVHQFSKVEMFVISTPIQSEKILSVLISIEEEIFSELGLHFKVMDMPTADLGAPAYRKFDIEAWMPGLESRRLNIRYEPTQGEKTKRSGRPFVHTLNATACAVPRMIVSILENFQREDGTVDIPEVLQPFMGGMKEISKGEK